MCLTTTDDNHGEERCEQCKRAGMQGLGERSGLGELDSEVPRPEKDLKGYILKAGILK